LITALINPKGFISQRERCDFCERSPNESCCSTIGTCPKAVNSAPEESFSLGFVLGGVFGGVGLVLMVALMVIYYRKRRSKTLVSSSVPFSSTEKQRGLNVEEFHTKYFHDNMTSETMSRPTVPAVRITGNSGRLV
jgi:hypothetical protein